MSRTTYSALFIGILPLFVLLMPLSASAAGNLIANPTFATSVAQGTSTVPASWATGAWGAAIGATFAYPVAGEDDAFAAQVSISSYPASGLGNGAAEWYFNTVPVSGGSLYTFSDWYKSDVDSYVIAQWTLSDNSVENDSIATLSPSSTWQNSVHIFSAPADAKSLTILHTLQSAGTLTVDNYSLTEGAVSQSHLPQAIVSLTFDDGWLSQYVNALPILQSAHVGGTFFIITDLISTTTPYDFFTDPNQSIVTTHTATSTTWSPIYTDPTVSTLLFTDTYTATTTSTVRVNYLVGSSSVSTVLGTVPAGTNAKTSLIFTLPMVSGSTVTPITIVQSASGTLSASQPSLVGYDAGYVTPAQLLDVQKEGSELASHTASHDDMTTETASQVDSELNTSRNQLLAWGASPVDGLAYPFGNYSAAIEAQTAAAHYDYSRTVDIGYNTESSDPFALKSNSVVATTPLSVVESWIDTAIANKLWLILTFHDIDSQQVLTLNGETFGTTPEELQGIVSYLQSKNVMVRTVHDALGLIASTTPPVDTTPPVITLLGDNPLTLDFGSTFTDPGATATDTVDGNLTSHITVGGDTVNTSVAGTYTLVYTVSDAAGNAASTTRSVIVSPEPAPVSSSGGGGGGGGGGGAYTLPTPAATSTSTGGLVLGTSTQATSTGSSSTSTTTTSTTTAPCYVFTKSLKIGSTGADVTALQKLLTSEGFYSGPITGYFGQLTSAGVKKFQTAHGISATGTVGPLTRAALNVCNSSNSTSTTNPSQSQSQGVVLGASTIAFTQTLGVGSTGDEVTGLQNRLTAEGFYSGPITGYFGLLTEAAVKAYQTAHGIPATGVVGPLTRAALNGQ